MQLNGALHDIDWGSIFDKVTSAVPGVVSTVYQYKTAKEQAEAQAKAAANDPFNMSPDLRYNPNYSGTYGNLPGFGGGSDYTPLLLGGVALVAVFLLMNTGKR